MTSNNSLHEELLSMAFQADAIQINLEQPFLWASGYKMPIYNDNRLLLANDSARRLICKLLIEVIEKEALQFETVAGVATAGIPHATLLADRLDLPLQYVRPQSKGHGKKQRIEGLINQDYQGKTVLLIEDAISTGGSALQAVDAIRQLNGHVTACLALFSYRFKLSEQAFCNAGCSLFSLLDFQQLLNYAYKTQRISKDLLQQLSLWHADPWQNFSTIS